MNNADLSQLIVRVFADIYNFPLACLRTERALEQQDLRDKLSKSQIV